MATPAQMPQRKPRRTWTPPAEKPQPVTPAAPVAGPRNAAARRARRNGGEQYTTTEEVA